MNGNNEVVLHLQKRQSNFIWKKVYVMDLLENIVICLLSLEELNEKNK